MNVIDGYNMHKLQYSDLLYEEYQDKKLQREANKFVNKNEKDPK